MDIRWILSVAFLAQIQFYLPYLITNVTLMLLFFPDHVKGLTGSARAALAWANLYGMAMVLPMIWVFRTSARFVYLFMLANVIFQLIYLVSKHKGKLSDLLVPLSLSNLLALFVMLFIPYLLNTQV